ncbi:uncharacterized protein LOC136085446 [Hydra vulgaris]|uniref:Uncharacterized protein LOC136085446 n=1 Tax=Hydra vulgaris TaxID=6087 RepID=A0ABM4CM03_HYDVU
MSKKRQSSNILDYFNFKRVATTDGSKKSQKHITLPQPVTARINDDLKYHILTEPFKPHETYDFKKDVPEHEAGKRRFRHAWLVQHAHWLAYSSKLKGAVCIYCILFPQKVHRGFQGAFITTAFRKCKDFNECARNHMSSSWRMCSQQDAENFMAVRRNPNKEIILVNDIVSAANNSIGFSVLADETADISRTEKLSIGIHFIDPTKEQMIRKEFVGFVPLNHMSSASVSDAILSKCLSIGLNLDRLLGQGYDGYSTMAGKDNGVQSRIRMKYPKTAFVHCSSHRLNLVVNDLSALSQIRNIIDTIKSIIAFFRKSPTRRSMIPDVPLLCETRWTAKYKSIRVFCVL